MHRLVALVAVLVGVAMIVTTFALSLFPRAYAGERLADNFAAAMSPEGVAYQKQGIDMLGGFFTGLDGASNAFAQQLRLPRAQFDRAVAADYPAVAAGVQRIPPAVSGVFAPVVLQLAKIEPKWQAVTHIPGLGLPIAGGPWLIVLAGGGLVLAGVLALAWALPATAAVFGVAVAMAIGTLAFSLPGKVDDSRAVLRIGRVALSPAAATAAHNTTVAFDDLISEIRFNMIPDLARRLRVSRAAVEATVARFPAMATAVREWPSIAPAAYTLTSVQAASGQDFKEVDGIGYAGLYWLALGPGIALSLLAGAVLFAGRGHERRAGCREPGGVNSPVWNVRLIARRRERGSRGRRPRRGVKPHRSFDPRRVGDLECAAWVAYYRREWLAFLRSAVALTRHTFGLPWSSTMRGAWLMLRANQLWAPFPDNDPDGARRAMARFYGLVARHHGETFDPAKAAQLEVEWWRVHREHQHADSALDERSLVDALAALYAYVYGVPEGEARVAAEQRAVAMRHSDRWVRDGCDLASPLIEEERAALVRSYAGLLAAVHRL